MTRVSAILRMRWTSPKVRSTSTSSLKTCCFRLRFTVCFLVQRSRPAAVLLSTEQWDQLNERLDDLEALVQYLEVKLKLTTGETHIEEVDLETLRAEVHGIPA